MAYEIARNRLDANGHSIPSSRITHVRLNPIRTRSHGVYGVWCLWQRTSEIKKGQQTINTNNLWPLDDLAQYARCID